MPSFGVALAWIIISPFAFLTNCLGVIIILHYKPLYHSCDVAFTSIFITMATNSWLLLPVPAVINLGDFYWSRHLCAFYTWLSITLRSSHLFVLLAINVYWMASPRVSPRNKMFTSSKPMVVCVCICWFVAIVAGLIPSVDVGQIFNYYEDDTCKFLPANVGRGFAIFFMILSLLSAVMGVISSLDTLLLFRSMKDAALSKYSADRFHIPTVSGAIQPSALIHAKYNELNVSLELCGLVLWFSIGSSVINAIPLLASQFVQLTQDYNRETMETTLLWLLLIESLILPHLLWMLSRRYRHATVYTWRVFVLRDTSFKEEDAAACTLQTFRLKVKDLTSRPYRNGDSSQQVNGAACRPVRENHSSDATRKIGNGATMATSNGLVRYYQDVGKANGVHQSSVGNAEIEDGMTALSHLSSSQVVVHAQNRTQGHYNNIQETSLMSSTQNTSSKEPLSVTHAGTDTKDSPWKSSTSANPYKSSVKKAGRNGEVKRSISTGSRTEWKARMMKKHLPAVFLGSSLEGETDDLYVGYIRDPTRQHSSAANNERENINIDSVSNRTNMAINHSSAHWSSSESMYYMSSDYHHNSINDTHSQTRLYDSGVDAVILGIYEDDDIGSVLDGSSTVEQTDEKIHDLGNSGGHSERDLGGSHNSTKQNSRQIEVIENLMTSKSRQQPPKTSSTPGFDNKRAENIYKSGNVFINRTASGYRNESDHLPESKSSRSDYVPQSTATSENTSLGYPNIRKSNYRKFLPYTNLIVSNVDDVVEDESNDYDDGSARGVKVDVKPTPENVSMSSPQRALLRHTLDSHESTVLLNEPDVLRQTHTRDKNRTNTELSTAITEDCLQDYGKLETLSGSEMLRIKMKSLRAATAIYNSDDTTSEEGGLDNTGFDDISDDEVGGDNEDNKGIYNKRWTDDSQTVNIQKLPDVKERSPGSGHSSPSASAENGFSSTTVTENNITDNEEPVLYKSTFVTKADVGARVDNFKYGLEHGATSDSLKIGNHEKQTLTSTDFTSKQIKDANNYLSNTFHLQQKSETVFRPLPDDPVERTDTTSSVTPKTSAPMIKPPRHRKYSNEGSLVRMNSLEDEFGLREKIQAVNGHVARSNAEEDYAILKEDDYPEISDASDCAEVESNSSGHSVTIEPYGHRRPLWMDDSLLSTTHDQNFDSPKKITSTWGSETSSMDETSTDFMTLHKGANRQEAQECNVSSGSIGEIQDGSHTLPPGQFQKPFVRFDFDEDTDNGFENALAVDYITHSNYYRSASLCFESIKEEPEESLSDSTSSLEHSDTGSLNVFKTRAVVSRPSSGGSITGLSPLEPAHSPAEDYNKKSFSKDFYLRKHDTSEWGENMLSTCERTSADGSEEIPPTTSSNGNVGSDPWGVAHTSGVTTSMRGPDLLQSTSLETHVVVENTGTTPAHANIKVEDINNKTEAHPEVHGKTWSRSFDTHFSTQNSDMNGESSESRNSRFKQAGIESRSHQASSTIVSSPSKDTTKIRWRPQDAEPVYF